MVGNAHSHHLRVTMTDIILLLTMIVVTTDIRLAINNSHPCLEGRLPYLMVPHHLCQFEVEKVGVEVVVVEEVVMLLMQEILLHHLTRQTVIAVAMAERRSREIAVARTDILDDC